jgi:hypothetical protein
MRVDLGISEFHLAEILQIGPLLAFRTQRSPVQSRAVDHEDPGESVAAGELTQLPSILARSPEFTWSRTFLPEQPAAFSAHRRSQFDAVDPPVRRLSLHKAGRWAAGLAQASLTAEDRNPLCPLRRRRVLTVPRVCRPIRRTVP